MNVLKRAALTAALVAAPFAVTQPAAAGFGSCTPLLPDVSAYFDCGANDLGTCTFFYDPLAQPVPFNVVPETGKYVGCVV